MSVFFHLTINSNMLVYESVVCSVESRNSLFQRENPLSLRDDDDRESDHLTLNNYKSMLFANVSSLLATHATISKQREETNFPFGKYKYIRHTCTRFHTLYGNNRIEAINMRMYSEHTHSNYKSNCRNKSCVLLAFDQTIWFTFSAYAKYNNNKWHGTTELEKGEESTHMYRCCQIIRLTKQCVHNRQIIIISIRCAFAGTHTTYIKYTHDV